MVRKEKPRRRRSPTQKLDGSVIIAKKILFSLMMRHVPTRISVRGRQYRLMIRRLILEPLDSCMTEV